MKYISYILFILLTVSCFETEEETTGAVYSGHKPTANLLSLVNPTSPTYYKSGETFYVVLAFPTVTVVTGVPDISIDIGGSPQTATFFDQGVNSKELWFEYTVVGGDLDADGIEVVPSVNLNGGTIKYGGTFDVNTVFTDTSASNLRVDAIAPNLTGTNVPANATYEYNQTMQVVLDYDEAVFIYGAPRIAFDLGGAPKFFNYTSGSGTSSLTFSYQVTDPDLDSDGIVINTVVDFNGGAGIKDAAGNLISSTTITPGLTPGILVDGDSPKVLSTTQPVNKTYGVGESLNFTMTFSEAVNVAGGSPRIPIDVGGSTLYADYTGGTGSTVLAFSYIVGIGEADSDGVTLISPFELNGSTVRDAGGRDALLTYTVPNTSFVNVDGVAPLAPVFVISLPLSPSDIDSPRFNMTTEAYATVKIYSDAACSVLVTSKAASSGGSVFFDFVGLPVGVNSYWATATDLAGNDSTCTVGSFDYEVYEIPPGMGWFQGINTTFGADLNQVGTYYSMIWSTFLRYDSDYYYHSSSTNPERITVLQAGDYKISFNLPVALASAAQRATIQAIVLVNGVAQDEAVSESSYIRNSDNHNETSTSLTILLDDLSINDYIEVQLRGRTVVGAVNTLERASVHLDYLGTDSIFYGKATEVTGGTNFNGAAPDALKWVELKESASYTHSDITNPENITITENGDYLVYVNLPVTSAVQRASVKISVKVNGTTIAGGIGTQGYIRAWDAHNNSSVHWAGLMSGITATDVVTITTELEAAPGTVTVQGGKKASLLIQKIDVSTNAISLRGNNVTNGANWNQGGPREVEWDNQDAYDPAVFTHDPFGASEDIIIQAAGDYLLLFNGAFTSTAQRAGLKIQVYVNGAQVSGAIGASAYIRASSGHDEGSIAFSHYLKDLKIGDVVAVRSQREAKNGTINTADDAKLFLVNYPF